MAKLAVSRIDDNTVNIVVSFTIKIGQTGAKQSRASREDKRAVGERTYTIDSLTITPREYNALHALLGNEPIIGSAPNKALGLSATLYVSEKGAGRVDLSRAVQPKAKANK